MREGHDNRHVYFLEKGSLNVYVQGERVASINTPGNILGEMSVVSDSRTSATVVAEVETKLQHLSMDKLDDLPSKIKANLIGELYQAFAVLLRNKLIATNGIARQFELANRELIEARLKLVRYTDDLEQMIDERTGELQAQARTVQEKNKTLEEKNTALKASYRKLEDLDHTKEQILHKVGSIHNKHLSELEAILLNLEGKQVNLKVDDGSSALVQSALTEIRQMQGQLKPIAEMYFTQRAIRNKRVLLVEDEYKHQIIAKMALGGTGVTLDIASDAATAKSLLAKHSFDMLCVNGNFTDVAAYAYQQDPNLKSVLMSSEDVSSYIGKLREHPFITNIISRKVDDKSSTLKSILTTVSKTLSNDVFGIEKYLNWGVDVRKLPIISSDSRKDLIVEMENSLKKLGIKPTTIAKCSLISEELLMNAIYDAPVDEDGVPKYNHLSRTQSVNLAPKEQGFFKFGFDGMIIAISTEDPHGAFHRDTVLDYLESHLSAKPNRFQQKKSKGGAGLGLYQILSTADLVVLNVKKKVRTEVIALINVNPDRRQRKKMSSFHYFLA